MGELWSITSNLSQDSGVRLRIVRIDDYHAKLYINDNGKDVVEEDVHLSFGARFGPDVADTQDWESRLMKYLDEERHKEA